MQINWWTLALQAVNFLVLIWLLWRFLYRPVRDVIEKRKELAERAFADADKKQAEAEAARQRFENNRAELAQERQELLRKTHEELATERRDILDAARREADELVEEARKSLDEARESTLAEVRDEIAALATELASGLLRKVQANAANGAFLEHLERQLTDIAAEERERLQKDLAADNARLTVVTADSLTDEERNRWTDRLSACLGHAEVIDFVTDPEILGGAELRFPHAVLKFSWADQLQKARELLVKDETAA